MPLQRAGSVWAGVQVQLSSPAQQSEATRKEAKVKALCCKEMPGPGCAKGSNFSAERKSPRAQDGACVCVHLGSTWEWVLIFNFTVLPIPQGTGGNVCLGSFIFSAGPSVGFASLRGLSPSSQTLHSTSIFNSPCTEQALLLLLAQGLL